MTKRPTKVKKFVVNSRLTLWVSSNWVILGSGSQYMRFSIYSTNNSRNFSSFRSKLLKLLDGGTNDNITATDVISLGVETKVNAWATLKPKDEDE